MLTETGRVVAIDKDGLWLETAKKSTCAQCSARFGCGQKLLAEHAESSGVSLIKVRFNDAFPRPSWQLGDRAQIAVSENALVLAALAAYGIPLLAMMCGLGAGNYFFPSDLGAFVGALAGLFFGGLFVKKSMHLSIGGFSCRPWLAGKLINVNTH